MTSEQTYGRIARGQNVTCSFFFSDKPHKKDHNFLYAHQVNELFVLLKSFEFKLKTVYLFFFWSSNVVKIKSEVTYRRKQEILGEEEVGS